MSEPSPPIDGEDEGGFDEGTELQFDQAELTTPASSGPSCDACKRPIKDAYYEINGKVICTPCRRQIEASLGGGSGLARFIKALVLGTGAAVVGAALYFIVTRATGWNIGIVAIVVGFMVGGAVRKGTGNRGGLLYQFLGVLLTYFAIGLTGLSYLVEEQFKEFRQQNERTKAIPRQVEKKSVKDTIQPQAPVVAANEGDGAKGVAPPKQASGTDAPAKARQDAASKGVPAPENMENAGAEADAEPRTPEMPRNLLVLVIFIIFIIGAGPVIHSIQAPISGLIYGFALWQAWQMNKQARIVFNGPFQVSHGGPAARAPGVPGDGG